MAKQRKRKIVRPVKRAVIVCWIDHAEPVNKRAWDVPTDPKHLFPAVVWSMGFIQSENDDIIELARDLSEFGTSGAPIHILKRCIKYCRPIRVGGVKK